MQFRKVLISCTLLLAYSFGFAHDLLPHCHHDGANASTHVVEHDGHHHHDHEGHEHHDKHADESLMDLLICLLSATEHSDDHGNDCFVVPTPTSAKANDRLADVQLAVVLYNLLVVPEEIVILSGCNATATALSSGPFLSSAPQRGPPVVS